MTRKTFCVSGGFYPLHVGHLELISHAATYGNVRVILNSDAWLVRKKGYCFMPWDDRYKILISLKDVMRVVPVDDADGTVCKALADVKPNYFANGGDRAFANPAEDAVCQQFGIEQLFDIGGGKIASSSEIVKKVRHDAR